MYAFKLTTQDMKTRVGYFNEVVWEPNKKVTATGKGSKLCSSDVIHSYPTPLLAMLMNPNHADIQNPRLFKARCTAIVTTDGLKQGHKSMTLISELEVPAVTSNQRIAFAILCSLEVEQSESYKTWAQNWLLSRDYTAASAAVAYYAATYDATYDAASADAAYYAARAAARAAAYAAIYAAAYDAAYYAAYAATYAASAATKKIDFAALAEKAMKFR